jgi:hypothetical protein
MALGAGAVNINERWALIFSVQVPFTVKRDFDLGLSTGVQAAF